MVLEAPALEEGAAVVGEFPEPRRLFLPWTRTTANNQYTMVSSYGPHQYRDITSYERSYGIPRKSKQMFKLVKKQRQISRLKYNRQNMGPLPPLQSLVENHQRVSSDTTYFGISVTHALTFYRIYKLEYIRTFSNLSMDCIEKQRVCIEFCFKLRKPASESFKMLKRAFKEDSLLKSRAFEWFARFKDARMIKSKLKCLLITLFDVKGLVHYEFVPKGQTINQHYYLDVLRRLREAVRQKRPENGIGKIGSCIMTTHSHIRPSLYNSIWLNTELLYYPSHPILLTLLPTTFSLTLKLKKS
ncbi:hypothetical protein LAZ67_21000085 [Cordylochernes scorpioides]|uniref:Mos1 transposase HTH domain-containing protein n=1 Tax=Cordylochernes scorpioides TaxID=51811 RepID=A0ABY6LNF1_9ARAC|nr:hypothetical protein LAZ67_21000085 [Cordylochernes scorpioides]